MPGEDLHHSDAEAPEPLRLEVSAEPARLSEIRTRLSGWLRSARVSDELAADIVLVVNEACTNSIEHGYRGVEHGVVVVHADVNGREICIEITDFGSWKPPDSDPRVRGRGVPLMQAVSRAVRVDGTSTGTAVAMSFPSD